MSYTLEEIQDSGLDDFRLFLVQVWSYLGLPRPTPVQLDIAYWLQHGDKRVVLEAFRGVGKSWITVSFVLWNLFMNPQVKIMVVSANETLSGDFTRFCQQLIQGMPLLQHLAPRQGQANSSIAFDVGPAKESKDRSLKSVGITGQLTGSRADIIIADDIEVPKNSMTHIMRERLAELVKEFDAVLKPEETSRIIYLGTPQVESSLYNRLTGIDGAIGRGYKLQIWPVEIPKSIDVYRGRLAPYVVRLFERGAKIGDPIEPTRFSKEDLAERKLSYGRAGYALQFMLDTSPASVEKHPLKLRDLVVMDVNDEIAPVKIAWSQEREYAIQELTPGGFDGDFYYRPFYKSPEMASFHGTVMAIDPSGRGKDETAGAIVRILHGVLYLVDVFGYLDGYADSTLKAIAGRAARHHVNYVIAEENYGGGMFNQLLKPYLTQLGAGKFDEDYNGWSSGNKEARIIQTLEPILRSHKLVVDRRLIEEDIKQQQDNQQYSLVFQLTRMELLKGALPHEDRLEAVAMACGYWTEKMGRDADKAVESFKDEALRQELKKFHNHVLGGMSNGGHYVYAKR